MLEKNFNTISGGNTIRNNRITIVNKNNGQSTMSSSRGLFKDVLQYLPSFIVPGIVGFFTIPIVTRIFPPEIYGNYVLVMAMVSIFSIFVGWVGMSIVRFYPAYERDSKLDEFYGTTLKLTAISIAALFFIFITVLLISKNHISPNLYYLMRIGLLVFVVTACFGILKEFLRIKRQVNWYTGFSIWQSVTALGFGIVLIMILHYGVEGLLWGSVLSICIAFPLLWKIAVGRLPTKTKGVTKPLALNMAKYGFPLVIGNLAAWILSLSDRYILEIFRGSHEVGIYSVSYGISEKSLMLVVSLFQIAIGPIAMQIWEREGKEPSKRFTADVTRYYLITVVPMVIGLSVLAKPIVGVLTATEYHAGYTIVPMVALSAFFLGLTQRYGIGFCYHNVTHYATLTMVVSALLNLGLNFLLVPKYGYIAAAWTTLISYALFLVLQIVISRQFFVWKFPFESLKKVVCASAVMGVVVYIIGNSLTSVTLFNLILGVGSGVLIYCGMLFLLREFKPSEIQALLALKVKIWRQ